jgi:ABC-type multidrug transport system ATPase subunit
MDFPPTEPRVAITGLSFSYGKRPIFRDFSWSSERQISVFRGPSGCGKTTLLKLLLGSLPTNSSAQLAVPGYRRMILQDDSLCPWLTGWQNIMLFSRDSRRSVEAHPLFEQVNEFIDRPAYQLSFGQRRLLELLRILVPKAGLILLDEPLNYLDRMRRDSVIAYLSTGLPPSTTVILSTHLTDELALPNATHYEFGGDLPHSMLVRSNQT